MTSRPRWLPFWGGLPPDRPSGALLVVVGHICKEVKTCPDRSSATFAYPPSTRTQSARSSPSRPPSVPSPIAGSPITPRAAAPTARHWRPCSPTSANRTSSWCPPWTASHGPWWTSTSSSADSPHRGVSVRFLKEGLTFQAAGEADPLATFQLQVMGAFAQLERALIRDRQREGIEAAKARGVYRGRARRLTPAQVAAAQAELTAGVPKAVVARRLGVARQTLYNALAAGGTSNPPDA